MKNSIKQKYFVDDWLTHDDFKIWLKKDALANKKARCARCHKSIEQSSSGRGALTDHGKRKKHQHALLRVKTFFKKPSTQNAQDVDKSPSTLCSDTTSEQTTLHSSGDTGSTKAEIKWTLKSVISGYSVRNNDDIKATFATMFPDSNITKMMTLNRTKSMYAINHGLAPFCKSALMLISKNQIFSHIHSMKV